MKRLRFISLLFSKLYSAGFTGDTLLLTKSGPVTFNTVDLNTLIQSNKNSFTPVLFFGNQSVSKVVQINIADEIIICHKKQLFWCTNQSDWVCAGDKSW